jgi:acyl CoA:acetate/3-ketoacid CoA transferase beta subunit
MRFGGEQVIVSRLIHELRGTRRVALGPGLPQQLIPLLADEIEWVDVGLNQASDAAVDVAVVEALEVSEKGDLAVGTETFIDGLQAERWVVAAPILRGDGETRIVRCCQFPVQKPGCVHLIVTELGVIEVGRVGFELRELVPGVASDDVRMKVRASLHVADDIARLRFGT